MKSGYILKSEENTENISNEMELVNKYTRRKFEESDVYIFSVVLCDNEVDRDGEMFTKEALVKLSELFVGKTGILDHNMKAENQKARIISCKVEEVPGVVNSLGQPYFRLAARAYTPRTDKNKDFITDIDSGIKKEVSVSCAVKEKFCSICSKNLRKSRCNHQKGNVYKVGNEEKFCYHVLSEPYDAYEWSFVAVPAQKGAGVIKKFNGVERSDIGMENILKSLQNKEEVTLSSSDSENLYELIKSLKQEAEDGKQYKEDLKREVIRLCAGSESGICIETMKSVADKMDISELKSFKNAFEKKSLEYNVFKPQLLPKKTEKKKNTNTEFKI